MSESIERSVTPLLPVVFFDSAQADVPARFLAPVISGSDTTSDPLRLNHGMLSTVASRLRATPAAHVILRGMSSGEEPRGLALQRAEAVARVLSERFGVSTEQITVDTGTGRISAAREITADGRAENRRVELLAADSAILSPVYGEHIDRSFDPPRIQLEPIITAEAGVRRWTLSIDDGERPVVVFSSDSIANAAPSFEWAIPSTVGTSSIDTLVAELIAVDSTGVADSSLARLPLVVEHSVRLHSGAEADRVATLLVAFDYDVADPSAVHRSELRRIASGVPPGARVQVQGFTDRIGSAEGNLDLARRRAEGVADVLRGLLGSEARVDVVSGSDDRLFPNDLPEGRILSRSVRILITRGPKPSVPPEAR